MRLLILGLFFSASIISCDYFKQDMEQIPVVRVNDTYLFQEDINELISSELSKEDSARVVSSYVNRWATQRLLIDQSKINLPQDKQDEFNKLVQQYKIDLFTEAYKGFIVSHQLDSVISTSELEDYYNNYKENFKLNGELLKVRYIHVDENFSNFSSLKEKFRSFDEEDKIELTDLSIQFKSFNLNDSVWVRKGSLLDALPVVKSKSNQVLKKSNFTQLQDSLGVYLVKIEEMLETNDIAPLSYIEPTIKQIILNRRKLELIKTFEKDITKDALKNKQFEIYPPQ